MVLIGLVSVWAIATNLNNCPAGVPTATCLAYTGELPLLSWQWARLTHSPDQGPRLACGNCDEVESDYLTELFGTTKCVYWCDGVKALVYVAGKDLERQDVDLSPENMRDVIFKKDRWKGGHMMDPWGAQIRPIIESVLPPILYHTSDEYCRSSSSLWNELYPKFQLVFRNHACAEEYKDLYVKNPNVAVIPLGYTRGLLGGNVMALARWRAGRNDLRNLGGAVLPIEHSIQMSTNDDSTRKRKYIWSFAGELRENRIAALVSWSTLAPRRVHITGVTEPVSDWLSKSMKSPTCFNMSDFVFSDSRLSKFEIESLYSESEFIVSPPGYQALDCFRHYEASAIGAIPVVVASSRDELQAVFGNFAGFMGECPPWIYDINWDDARRQAEALLSDPVALNAKRAAVVKWWKKAVQAVHKMVATVDPLRS